MRKRQGLIALVLTATVVAAPAVASAISFSIGLSGEGFTPLTRQEGALPAATVTGTSPSTGGTLTTVQLIAGTYTFSPCDFEGCVPWTLRISNIGTLPSQQARIIATDSPTTDTLKLSGALITFLSGEPDADFRIRYVHDFINAPAASAFYGLNLTETYGRRVNGVATTATGDSTNLTSEAGFDRVSEGILFEQIAGAKLHSVGTNSFGPSPSTEAISCLTLESATDINLDCGVGERIRTTAFLHFDRLGDTLRIGNTWVAAGECETVEACEEAIALAAVPVPGTLLLLGAGLAVLPLLRRTLFRE